MKKSNWNIYFKKHSNRKPKEQLVNALEFCINKDNALDLGAGNLIESKAILDFGFKKVVAVDDAPETLTFAKEFKTDRFDFQNVPFREYNLPENTFDLINAEFSLPFYGKDGFNNFWIKLSKSIKTGGVFTGQLFGVNDSWNTPNSDLVFHTKKELENLLSLFEVLEFTEEEKDSPSVSDTVKHWHIFRFILRKQ